MNDLEIVTDYVCGMKKPKGEMKITVVYQGQTYYFCSDGDKEIFVANPSYWVPKNSSTS